MFQSQRRIVRISVILKIHSVFADHENTSDAESERCEDSDLPDAPVRDFAALSPGV